VAVGIGQIIAAIFPGTSRSGATIILALILGLNRVAATEFTFLVGIPTMLAASSLKIFKRLHHPPVNAPVENWQMVFLGSVVAAVVSFIAVKWLLRYVQTHTFVAFGWYRIGLAILLALLLITGKNHRVPGDSTKTEHPSPSAL
jgi:undecaprenyl-diphosphatase